MHVCMYKIRYNILFVSVSRVDVAQGLGFLLCRMADSQLESSLMVYFAGESQLVSRNLILLYIQYENLKMVGQEGYIYICSVSVLFLIIGLVESMGYIFPF